MITYKIFVVAQLAAQVVDERDEPQRPLCQYVKLFVLKKLKNLCLFVASKGVDKCCNICAACLDFLLCILPFVLIHKPALCLLCWRRGVGNGQRNVITEAATKPNLRYENETLVPIPQLQKS